MAPRVADWPVLLTKLGQLLSEDYDFSEELVTMRVPTLLVYGDGDSVRTSHGVAFYEHLGGGQRDAGWDGSGRTQNQLAILPDQTHYTIFHSAALATTVSAYLLGTISTKA